jgi:hypothetical protein
MPINLQCPRCGHLFAVPDHLAGQQVACKCGQPISVVTSAFQQPDAYGRSRGANSGPPGASPNPYASPKSGGQAWVMSRSPELRLIATGLTLVLIGLALSLLSMLVGMTLGLGILVAALGVGSRVCTIVGQVMCLLVPQETGAKPLIIASVALMLAAAVVAGIMPLFSFESLQTLLWLAALSMLLPLASLVCFVLFLRTLAEYVGRQDVAEDCSVLLILLAVMIGVGILMFVVGLASLSIWLARVFELANLILYVVFLVKYIGVLGALRNTLLRQ